MSSSGRDAARGARRASADEEDEGLGQRRTAHTPQSLPSGSWESQASFDDAEEAAALHRTRALSSPSRPSSSGREHNRKFDTTTPTLIDEDEDAEMVFRGFSPSPSKQQQPPTSTPTQHSEEHRRTPGAAMYKSLYEVEDGTQNLRLEHKDAKGGAQPQERTGEAERDAHKQTRPQSQPQPQAQAHHSRHNQEQQGIWESFSTHSGTPSPTHRVNTSTNTAASARDQIQPSRPPLAPPTASSSNTNNTSATGTTYTSTTPPSSNNTTSTTTPSTSRAGEARGLFSSAPWARNTNTSAGSSSNNNNTPGGDDNVRPHGAFSPNLLRLTEDIGNILHEDEDDEYAVDIPALGGTGGMSGEELSQFGGGDWSGSYVFNQTGEGLGQRRLPRTFTVPRSAVKEGRTRRNPGMESRRVPVQHAPKPQPRRTGNEVPLFAAAPVQGQNIAPPQLLNFRGAFEPPGEHHSFSPIQQPGSPFHPLDRPGSADFRSGAFEQLSSPSPSPRGGNFFHIGSPSPTAGMGFGEYGMPPAGQDQHYHHPHQQPPPPQHQQYHQHHHHPHHRQHHKSSEMHATAREFVPAGPRAAMTPPPPQFSAGPGWSTQPLVQPQQRRPQAPFEPQQQLLPHAQPQQQQQQVPSQPPPPVDTSWHGYGYDAGMAYRMPSPTIDVRVGLTPSPSISPWGFHPPQHQLQAISRVPESDRPLSVSQQSQPSFDLETPPPPPGTPTSQEVRDATKQGRKDTKRGKRGKKKPKALKKGKEVSTARPGSSLQESEDGNASGSDTNVDPKRTELEETQAARLAFKDFFKAFRNAEKDSFQSAEEFALEVLNGGTMPESVHWRIYLELADLAKRSNRYVEARSLYKRVCELQPYANQGWLEYSKLEEECGHMNRVTNILHCGLEYCEYSENLLTRAVKHQEKLGNLDSARELLARLKHVGIDKVWKTVLEGALLEARAGNSSMARRVLKYLMHHVPWYGPLYLEAYKLERDLGHPMDALQIVEQGLQAIPRYGPLWFGAFRLCEDLDMSQRYYALPQTMGIIARATMNISKELVWKVHLEAAQMLERSALEQAKYGANVNDALEPARHRFALTVLTCPNNLRWKVWLATARMELSVGNSDTARVLFTRAHTVVPDKSRSASLLDCARLEEFVGDTGLARAVLCKGRVEYVHDWKVWLESVLLEMRSNQMDRAAAIATDALALHKGTGRLWATLVQLNQPKGGDEAQHQALRRALNAVPKSGEVWCEGARIHLNPFSDTFDLTRARRHLYFATKFTPQYGDSFIESLRLEMLKQWLEPVATFLWEETRASIEPCSPTDDDRLTKYVTDILLIVSIAWNGESTGTGQKRVMYENLLPPIAARLQTLQASIDLSDLRLACSNADPNYGSIWFACRRVPTDTPRRVIEDAAGDVVAQIQRFVHLYIAAMVRRLAVLSSFSSEEPSVSENPLENTSQTMAEWEARIDAALLSAPSLQTILNPADPTTGLDMFQSIVDGADFVTAMSALTKGRLVREMPLSERRKALFGTDALFT